LSRLAFLLTTFVTALLAFYSGLAVNVFSTPYLDLHIGVPLFTAFSDVVFGYAAAFTAVVGLISLLTRQIEAWHYGLLIVPFAMEFGVSWYFFVAWYGI